MPSSPQRQAAGRIVRWVGITAAAVVLTWSAGVWDEPQRPDAPTRTPAATAAPTTDAAELAPPEARAALSRLVGETASVARAAAARGTMERRPDAADEPAPRVSARRASLLEGAGVLVERREALTVAGVAHQSRYLTKGGVPVLNRRVTTHRDGDLSLGISGSLATPAFAAPDWRIGRSEALEIAVAAVPGFLRGEPRVRRGWIAGATETVPGWRIQVPTHRPLGSHDVAIDARSGEILWTFDRLLAAEGSGTVHDQNPVEAPVPSTVTLKELDGSGQLSGTYVRLHDLDAPDAYQPSLDFDYPVGDPRLVQTSVYWTSTRAAAKAVKRGFPRTAFPLVAWVNLKNPDGSEYNNAFYDPGFQLLVFGNGDGTSLANIGTDADVAAHEMGHHIFETLARPDISSVSDPAAAMHEGFADLWAALVNRDPMIGESVLPGQPALREIRTNRKFPDDDHPDDPHGSGRIYGGAGWDLVESIGRGRVEKILIAGMPFMPPDPEPLDFKRALNKGDNAVFGGAHRQTISQISKRHGFPSTKIGDEYLGFMSDGVTEQGRVPNGDFVFWNYVIPPGSTSVRVQMTGTNDADLFVVGPDSDPDNPSTYLQSRNFGSSESVTVTRFTNPSVSELALGIGVVDNPNDPGGSDYQITATATIGPVDLVLGGPAASGNLTSLDQIDLFTFHANSGDHVRVDTTSLSSGLDLVAILVDANLDTLAADDDSGPGLDPMIQGARIPAAGRYSVAMLAWYDDVDPRRSLGRYTVRVSLCPNTGVDTDSDGTADVCDDDDDDDTFDDAFDADPLDPLRCFDVEADGCDDCTSGTFDPFNDGPDADGDSVCDTADIDDDSDGCLDVVDPFPLTPSPDDDLDFLASDCDVCPLVPDPAQDDSDGDGLGDACASCNPVQWTAPVADPPDQNPRRARVLYKDPRSPGRQDVRIRGQFNPAPPATGVSHLSGAALGAHVRFEDSRGVQFDLAIPDAGTAGCDPADTWATVDAFTSQYRNVSGALPPSCAPGSAADLTALTLYDTDRDGTGQSRAIGYSVRIDDTTLPFNPRAKPTGLRFTFAFGNPVAAGFASPEAQAGWCAELNQTAGGIQCRKTQVVNGVLRKLTCD